MVSHWLILTLHCFMNQGHFILWGGTTGNKLVIVPRKSARPDITFVPYWHHLHLFSLFPLFSFPFFLGCLINFIILVFVSCSRLDSELPKPAVTLLNDCPSSVLLPLVCFFFLSRRWITLIASHLLFFVAACCLLSRHSVTSCVPGSFAIYI